MDALTMMGYPTRAAKLTASDGSVMPRSVPGTMGTPAFLAISRAWTLLPIKRMASGDGPMKVMPEASHIVANSAFSERNP